MPTGPGAIPTAREINLSQAKNLGEFTLLDSQGQEAGGTGGAGAVKGSREAPRALNPSANTQGVMMAMPSPPPQLQPSLLGCSSKARASQQTCSMARGEAEVILFDCSA